MAARERTGCPERFIRTLEEQLPGLDALQTVQKLASREERTPYKVGTHEFRHTGMGMALKENGLVKVLAGAADELLGCHIVGPSASILIQEAVVAMNTTGKLDAIIESVHAHPALPRVVEEGCKSAAAATV